MATAATALIPTLAWKGDIDGALVLIDQTRLPTELVALECRDLATVCEAIRMLRVRGAPAIGVSAAYGAVVGLQSLPKDAAGPQVRRHLDHVLKSLAATRPTAVNLFWAIDRMRRTAETVPVEASVAELSQRLLAEAKAIHEEDTATCRAIGLHGAAVLGDGSGVLTHCNAGALATSDYGTALAVIFAAHEQGKRLHVYADETRPLLQGARLTAWELQARGVPATLICDSMAAQVMREGRVQAVVVGADRIAANGDTANKIGTYSVAILAAYHKIPFYVAAPASTFDLSIADGSQIPIEQRAAEEITQPFGRRTAPEGISVYNPAFDVTPAALIRGIICEHGLIEPVTRSRIAEMLGR